jgi:hypothetical protein
MTWVLLYLLLWLAIRMVISIGTRPTPHYGGARTYRQRDTHSALLRSVDDRHGR